MEESNPWPTFVDAFSTVLCIFIFLMLVFVLNSMLVMYESSKKSYAAASRFQQEMQQQRGSHTQTGGEPAGHDNAVNTSRLSTEGEKTAERQPGSSALDDTTKGEEQADKSTPPDQENTSLHSVSGMESTADIAKNTGPEGDKSDVVRLAKNNRQAGTLNGQNTGRFDASNTSPAWESKGNQFIIHFKGMEQGYPEAVISEIGQWIGKGKPVSIAVYAWVPPSVAISDAMRLAYERGVILLKIVKSKYPNAEVSISVVNDSSTLTNSAVITKSE